MGASEQQGFWYCRATSAAFIILNGGFSKQAALGRPLKGLRLLFSGFGFGVTGAKTARSSIGEPGDIKRTGKGLSIVWANIPDVGR